MNGASYLDNINGNNREGIFAHHGNHGEVNTGSPLFVVCHRVDSVDNPDCIGGGSYNNSYSGLFYSDDNGTRTTATTGGSRTYLFVFLSDGLHDLIIRLSLMNRMVIIETDYFT